jgi:hypothetical protein
MAERNPSDTQAAFGVFPQLKRNRSKQDREAAKNVPIDLARGAVAGVLGAPGDIESLVRMLPYLDEKTILPTSEDIEKKLPFRSDTPVSRAATGLGTLGGGFYYGPGSPLKVVGALPRAIKHGAEEFAKASVAGAPHVVKPTGGNWLTGSVEKALDPLIAKGMINNREIPYGPEFDVAIRKRIDDLKQQASQPDYKGGAGRVAEHLERDLQNPRTNEVALNKWVQSNLSNYVKKQMATPEDPVRKMAEEGITHFPVAEDPTYWARKGASAREDLGGTQMAQSDLAKQWENRTDPMIARDTAQEHQQMMRSAPGMYSDKDEWIKKLAPETNLYSDKQNTFNRHDLGFDHIMDVLRQDLAAGRIRPEQLNKVSMEQAVRRTYEFDQEMAKRMRETALKQQEGFPVHKEYPEGYRWIELAPKKEKTAYTSENLPQGFKLEKDKEGFYQVINKNEGQVPTTNSFSKSPEESLAKFNEWAKNKDFDLENALQYEGNTMGHCVGGYCPDVLSGNTRIFSLRDAKGEPHVTIETRPNPYAPRWDDVKPYMAAATEEAKKLPNGYTGQDISDIAIRMAKENMPENIVQIKGKQNAKPKEQYLPYVQDFVRGGKWGDVGDLKNTDLYKADPEELGMYMPTDINLYDMQGKRSDMLKRAKQAGLFPEGQKYVTRDEWEGILRKQYDAEQQAEAARKAQMSKPPTEGDIQDFLGGLEPEMKRGGKVSISKNPDTMMLELGNRKMAKGGKAVKFVEDVAPAAIEKLAMMFGNKLPLNMNSAEIENLAKRFPEPVVDRVNMAHKDVLKRTPELQEAAARIEAGDMSADEYARLVQRYKPVTPYESVPAPASREEILAALSKTSREAEGLPRKETYFGKPSSTLKEGDPVGLRLDIPSYNQANTWVVTAHGPRKSPVSGGAGTRIGYEPVAMATDVDFSVSPKAALGIAKGAEKNTIATMEGKWKPTSSDEAFTLAKQYLKNPEWRQVGMDPERHSFFYDRETMAPVINAEEVIQIGPLVLAKNPKYGNPKDFKYAHGGDVHMAGGGLTKLLKGALKAEPEIMKASEALGKIEGRPLVITQADRTKVGEGYLGGPGFSSLQLTEPEYRAAEAAWGVKNAGTAKMILGGGKKAGANPVYTTMIGSPTQHQSNQMVFDKLYGDFKKAAKKGGLPPELRDKINDRLAKAVDKDKNPIFPSDIDILDKNFKDIANTFDRRSIAGHLMGGVQVGGKKGQIIDYDKIIRDTTDPALIDVPSGSLGNRLFTLSGGIIDRPDLHPAFPTILQGEDLGVSFSPVAREILMRDFIDKTMREKKRVPGYMDYTRGHPPSQLITEDILTEMQKLGLKGGGAVNKPADGIKQPAAYINGDEFVNAAKKYGIKDSMNNLNKIVDLVNKGLSVDDAARQVADSGMHKAAGGAISGDDLIIEERPL